MNPICWHLIGQTPVPFVVAATYEMLRTPAAWQQRAYWPIVITVQYSVKCSLVKECHKVIGCQDIFLEYALHICLFKSRDISLSWNGIKYHIPLGRYPACGASFLVAWLPASLLLFSTGLIGFPLLSNAMPPVNPPPPLLAVGPWSPGPFPLTLLVNFSLLAAVSVSSVSSVLSSSSQLLLLLWADSESCSSDSFWIGPFWHHCFWPPATSSAAGDWYLFSMGLLSFTIIGHTNEIAVNVLLWTQKIVTATWDKLLYQFAATITCRLQIYYKVFGSDNLINSCLELGGVSNS